MDRTKILSAKDARIMHEFSRRCIEGLRSHIAFRFVSAPFHDFLKDNVEKEIQKDCLIIGRGVELFEKKNTLEDTFLDDIYEKTKDVDKEFMERAAILPLILDLRYNEIERVRKERIALLVQTVFTLLRNWTEPVSVLEVIRKSFTRDQFEIILRKIFRLYCLETRIVTDSIRLPGPGWIARDVFLGTLFSIMEETGHSIAYEHARTIFEGTGHPCHELI